MTSNASDTNNHLKVFMEQRLQELEWDFSRLAREYGRFKEQGADVDPNRYRSTVVRIVQGPERDTTGVPHDPTNDTRRFGSDNRASCSSRDVPRKRNRGAGQSAGRLLRR